MPVRFTANGKTCVAAAGIVLQPTFLIAGELASGQLVEELPKFRASDLGIYAVYPTPKFVLPNVRVLLEFLSAKLQDAPWVIDR